MEEAINLWEIPEVMNRYCVYEHAVGLLEDGDYVGYQTVWIFKNLLRKPTGEIMKRYSVDLQTVSRHTKWSEG